MYAMNKVCQIPNISVLRGIISRPVFKYKISSFFSFDVV